MTDYIALDVHRKYTFMSVERNGKVLEECRIEHSPGTITNNLSFYDKGTQVAVEATGNWYWIIDEIEAAGMVPRLVHPRKAKLMMGMINKTDKIDARGLNVLQRNNTLPTVWIPEGDLRDKRDLPRTRMVLTKQRTRLKNRLSSSLARYGLKLPAPSDTYGPSARQELISSIKLLPMHTRYSAEIELDMIDDLKKRIDVFEEKMHEEFQNIHEVGIVDSLPGVGFILAVVIVLEVGDVDRFACSEKLASYSGTVPRVHSSGGKTRLGRSRSDVNRYLKWAFKEAANSISLNRERTDWPNRHVVKLYNKIKERRGHQKAIGAVARHLAESTYWMLTKNEPYRDPEFRQRRRKREAGINT